MKRSRSTLTGAALALLLSNPHALAAQQPARPSNPWAEIFAEEQALAGALHARNGEALERLLAADFLFRGAPDVDRSAWLQGALTVCWGERSDIGGFRAHPQGDVVVASFELTFYVNPTTCRPAVMRSLVTDVWTRESGAWRLRVRHATPPPPTGAGIAAHYSAVPEPPPTWVVSNELSLVATGGNTSTRTVGLGARVTHRANGTSTVASMSFISSEADEQTKARSVSAQLRESMRAGARLELFGDASYARDRFAGIDNRAAAAFGAAYTAALPSRHVLKLEASVGYTSEQRVEAADLRFATGSGALSYTWKIVAGSELHEDVRLTADLQEADNWRGTSMTAVTVTLTRLLSLKASHAFEYRATPVSGFGRTDLRTSAALVFAFRR